MNWMVFFTATHVAAAGVGLIIGVLMGLAVPVDDRRDVDELARRDRKAVR